MPKTQKIEFQICSMQGELFERESINLFMRYNGITVSSVNVIENFRTPEGIKNVMEAFVSNACKLLFPKKVIPCKKKRK